MIPVSRYEALHRCTQNPERDPSVRSLDGGEFSEGISVVVLLVIQFFVLAS